MSVSPEVLDAALADLQGPLHRPSPLQWLNYAVTARSPRESRTWVLHDVTTRTWVLRHGLRSLVFLIPPVILVLLFLPTSMDIRLLLIANAGLPSFLAGMLFTLPASERRLVNAHYPAAMGQAIRQHRTVGKQRADDHARRERIAAKRARRHGM